MKFISFSLFFLLLSTQVFAQKPNRFERKLVKSLEGHISYLASDELQGRGTGSEGEQLSAQYVAEQMSAIGLETKGEDGYFQHLDITTLRIAQGETSLMIGKEVYTLFQDFFPLSASQDDGMYRGFAMNVKHGIDDESLSWNDYASVDVTGKAVLIQMETPEADNPHSKFAVWGGVERRANYAKSKGAAAIIFYSANTDATPSGELKKLSADLGLPIVFVKKDLSALISPQIDLTVAILSLQTQASNVIGFINHGAAHTVVLGAHHDHLGHGENGGSRAETTGEIHNGADDNASGIGGMLEMARIIKNNPKSFSNNNYLFIAFTAEELGLVGSKYFIKHPTVPLKQINYMINLDMIGNLDSTKKTLVINGVGTSPAWNIALEETHRNSKKIATIKTTASGIGSSDHSSFYLSDIPAIHFFTGQHEHYHKPSDDIEIVNFNGTAFVVSYLCAWMEEMDELGKVAFTKTKDETQGRMRFKVTLGIMPDYIYDGEGLRIDGVKEGKPGHAAGMQKGDIVTSMNGKPIMNMKDYMKMLAELNTGDLIPVKVKRGEEFLDLEVQF